jgi:hypothetical protein
MHRFHSRIIDDLTWTFWRVFTPEVNLGNVSTECFLMSIVERKMYDILAEMTLSKQNVFFIENVEDKLTMRFKGALSAIIVNFCYP